MALYLIGDVQGCNSALQRLLDAISFSPSRDHLVFLGDLVNRGPDSAGVLRRLMGYGASVQCVLGNHDLHLLAAAHGARRPSRKDTLQAVLSAPDRDAMLEWLRHQPMALLQQHHGTHYLMVHAGVLPTWTATKTLALAKEVEDVLQSPALPEFLQQMYGNEPARWRECLSGTDRLRVIVNALTRLRYCTPDGEMEFSVTDGPAAAPAGYLPWFDVPGRASLDVQVAFGHWSTLGYLNRPNLLALDTGCVWGGCLSAIKIDGNSPQPGHELIQVHCEQSQQPGT